MSDLIQDENIQFINEISNIYTKLSINDEIDFDFNNENKNIINFIEKCFENDNFLQIETKKLTEDTNLINNSFVKLIKFCINEKFEKFGNIFINYCDYFDLDYRDTFLKLHEKLQKLIERSCVCLIGEKTYKKYKNKNNINKNLNIITLFDLVKK